MKYDITKESGVYSAHPTFEPIGTPATVVDYAEDGSWMVFKNYFINSTIY